MKSTKKRDEIQFTAGTIARLVSEITEMSPEKIMEFMRLIGRVEEVMSGSLKRDVFIIAKRIGVEGFLTKLAAYKELMNLK